MTNQPAGKRSARASTPSTYPVKGHAEQPGPAHSHQGHSQAENPAPQGGHGGHRLMMVACCIPMFIIVGLLVATGVVGTGAIVYALVCVALMALMMVAMPGGHQH